jgi:hypothetical protein
MNLNNMEEVNKNTELDNTDKKLHISDVSDSVNNKVVYIVIDQDMHSYESILGIYDTFEGAMNCNAWSNRGIVPNQNGEGGSLFIYKEYVNEELSPKY